MTSIFSYATLCAASAMLKTREPEVIKIVSKPLFTKNHFGPLSEIAGQRVRVLERNEAGDCSCLFVGRMGENIVDVDRRDIQKGV